MRRPSAGRGSALGGVLPEKTRFLGVGAADAKQKRLWAEQAAPSESGVQGAEPLYD